MKSKIIKANNTEHLETLINIFLNVKHPDEIVSMAYSSFNILNKREYSVVIIYKTNFVFRDNLKKETK